MPEYTLIDGEPIRPVGGRVLHRATMAAMNRVPGRVGRYNVTICGDVSLLSEFLPSGEACIALFGPARVMFPGPDGTWDAIHEGRNWEHACPTARELRGGWPFKRIAAILNIIAAEPVVLNWDADYLSPRFAVPRGGTVPRGRMPVACGNPLTLWSHGVASAVQPGTTAVALNDEARATYCGSTRYPRSMEDMMYRILSRLEGYTEACRTGSATRARSAWRAVVNAHCLSDGEAPPDVLADISPEPELWNSETDPGGEGDPAGADNGESSGGDDDEPEYDDDGEPVRRRPRRMAGSVPRQTPGPRSSFADWEQSAQAFEADRLAARAAMRERINMAMDEAARITPEQIEAARAAMNRGTVIPEPGCDHCRNERECHSCSNSGQCGSCGGPFPAPGRIAGPALVGGIRPEWSSQYDVYRAHHIIRLNYGGRVYTARVADDQPAATRDIVMADMLSQAAREHARPSTSRARSGDTIRGQSINFVVIDEAAEVF